MNDETERRLATYLSQAVVSLINQETPEEYIKTRPGPGGTSIKYVEGSYVIRQLNLLFGHMWDFEVLNERIESDEVVVLGKLTVRFCFNNDWFSISKTQNGSQKRHSDVPLGDTCKAAATDALKKCASLIGIALDVYASQMEYAVPPTKQELRESAIERVYALAKEAGVDADDLAQKDFGKPVAELSVRELASLKRRLMKKE